MSISRRGPVLVTGALGEAGRSLCRQLRDRGVLVVGADMAAHEAGGLHLRQIPSAADRNFVPELMRVALAANADLLIPTVSAELPILAGLAGLPAGDQCPFGAYSAQAPEVLDAALRLWPVAIQLAKARL